MIRILSARSLALSVSCACTLFCCALWVCMGRGQTTSATASPNALKRLMGLHLPRLEGPVPVYYSDGLKALALQDQAEITDCATWYSQQLHITVPVITAVLNRTDWDRVGNLMAYPMAQALADEGSIIFMPDSFATFPGQNRHVDLKKKLDFIAFHETGHLYQRALHLEGPDLFMQEFSATLLGTAYALARRPELVDSTLDSRTTAPQRYTSFEDIDLIYEGVGFNNYDWLQVETVRLAVYFVKGRDLAGLVKRMQAAFPAGRSMSNKEVLSKLDTIRPGFVAQAGSLANPTTLKPITPGTCRAEPQKRDLTGSFGVRNDTGRGVTVIDDGQEAVLPPGYTAEYGKIGSQFKLPSGKCITYQRVPGYIVLR